MDTVTQFLAVTATALGIAFAGIAASAFAPTAALAGLGFVASLALAVATSIVVQVKIDRKYN